MITWIQRTLYKHMRIVFSILLVFIIAAFVFFTGKSSQFGGPGMEKRDFYGYNLNDQQVSAALQHHGMISFQLSQPNYIRSQEDRSNFFLFRMAMLSYADRLGIPTPSSEEFDAFVKDLPAFRGMDGKFSVEAYNQNLSYLRQNYADATITQVIQEDYRIAAAEQLFVGQVYSQPYELKQRIISYYSEYGVKLVTLNEKEIPFEFNPSDEQISAFYEQNKLRYQIPAKAKIDYVFFPLETKEPTIDALRNHYNRNKNIYQAEIKAAKPEITAEELGKVTADEALELIRNRIVADYQKRATEASAYKFFNELNFQTLHDPKALEEKVKTDGLELQHLAPFSQEDIGTLTSDFSPVILQQALSLDANSASGQLPTDKGFVVFIKQGEVPAYIPELSFVKDQVVSELKTEEQTKNFVAKGKELKDILQLAINEGKAIDESATAAHATVKDIPVLKVTEPGTIPVATLQSVLSTPDKKASDMVIDGESGYIVIVEKRTPPSEEEVEKQMAMYEQSTNAFNQSVFSAAMRQEIITRGMNTANNINQ